MVFAGATESRHIVFFTTGLNSKSNSKDGKSLCSSNSKVSSTSLSTPSSEGEILQSSNLKNFSFGELKVATRNFRSDSGPVFKRWVDEQSVAAARPVTGLVIAVKRLNQEGLQGHREWLAEINYLGQFSHPNLVKLIGYCLEDDHFWFMSSCPGAVWRVIYSGNYNAKLSDFGLARDGPVGDKSHVSTRVMRTHGHAAPEYLATEMLSSRPAIDKNWPSGQHNLVEWAKPYLTNKRRVLHVLDPRLEGQYALHKAIKIASLALKCLSVEPRFRPTMDEVVKALEQLQQPKDAPKITQKDLNLKCPRQYHWWKD